MKLSELVEVAPRGPAWSGRMGGNMAARLADAGHEVLGDAFSPASQVGSLAELVDGPDAPGWCG